MGRILKLWPGLVAFSFWAILVGVYQVDFSRPETKNRRLATSIDSGLTQHLILGYKFIVGDLFWIRFLQDVDYKESDHVSKGWGYHMLDNITVLDPRYHIAYIIGGTILSVLVGDKEGAAAIFDRALINFPTDWTLNYRAGYHYLFELKNCKRAAALFDVAATYGGPVWLSSLASRLYFKSGQYQIARAVLIDSIRKYPNSIHRPELEKRLKELDEDYNSSSKTSLIKGLDCQ